MSPPRFIAALAAFLLVALPLAAQDAVPVREELVVDSQTAKHSFEVEIADDPQERARGLMFRREMADEHGMLFDFGEEQQASFWMENTYIPLDMIFINEDGTVDSIAEQTTPLSRRSVVSDGPVRYVLEINGGLSDELGIEPGDTVSGSALDALQ
jgi:uncharacterized membrane protein (UPF0127 family)